MTGKPIAGVAVQATQVQQVQGQSSQSQTFKSTTATDGVFVLENLHPIPAFLSIEKGGYLKETRRYGMSAGLNAKESVIWGQTTRTPNSVIACQRTYNRRDFTVKSLTGVLFLYTLWR
jgi:hypothetical protein